MSVFFGKMGVELALAGEALAAGLAQVRLHELVLHQQVIPVNFSINLSKHNDPISNEFHPKKSFFC